MFLCDRCHDPKCPMEFMENVFRSRGRCEDCGKGAACYDCQGYKTRPSGPVVAASPAATPKTVVHQRVGTKGLCNVEPGVSWRDAYDAFAPDDMPRTVNCVVCIRLRGDKQLKHLAWCKERALEYVDRGELTDAFASMCSDMGKDDSTREHPALALGAMLMVGGHLDTPHRMREWIEGFN